jgi:hypothetical protein
MRRFFVAGPAFAGALWLVAARAAAAQSAPQAPAYLAALRVPPAAVGTCMPAPAVAGRDTVAGDLRGRRLVMTSRAPGARREMTVYTDAAGRVRRYSEMVHRMTGASASMGESVLAAVAPDGGMSGVVVRTTVAMKVPAGSRVDTAALRAMREQAMTTQARDTLGTREQVQVRAAAAWLLRRCPAEG